MASSPSLLLGKLALVTGGSGTIGKAIAKSLVCQGASVVLTARRKEKLEEAREELIQSTTSDFDNNVFVIPSDVSKEESVVELFQQIDNLRKDYEDKTGIDLLINNAGTMAPGPTVELSAEDMQRVLSVNVIGPFLCAREAMKRMKLNGGGRIVNIGSISSSSPRPDSATCTLLYFDNFLCLI